MIRLNGTGEEVAERREEKRNGKRMKAVPVTVVLPDCSAFFLELREDCNGHDCLAKMCDLLGIVETDYFGLKYSDRFAGCDAWINNRLNLKRQLKRCHRPFTLVFRVKFFTDPQLLQQPSTKQAFFKDLKHQIQRGQLTVLEEVKKTVGGLTAQIEIGDYRETHPHSPALVYPAYFPDWNDGIAFNISKEHKKLRGMSKETAVHRYIVKVCELEMCGATYYPAFLDNQPITVCIGPRHVHLLDTDRRPLNRIPYYTMTQVSFGSSFFGLQYHSRDEDRNTVDKKLRVTVRNNRIARHLFRAATEQQVFFYQATVLPEVRNHADSHCRRMRNMCRKVFLRKASQPEYYFDIQRTKHEAYSHGWQILHQVHSAGDGSERDEEEGERERSDCPYATVTIESDDSTSQVDIFDTNKPYWGLSVSSCNLARDLLAEPCPHLHTSSDPQSHSTLLLPHCTSSHSTTTTTSLSSPSHSLLLTPPPPPSSHTSNKSSVSIGIGVGGGSSQSQGKPRLSQVQSKKLRQLLLKIQDERICQVCMSAVLSAVFCPCGHHVACYRCAKRLAKCPICRTPVGYVQYVYTH